MEHGIELAHIGDQGADPFQHLLHLVPGYPGQAADEQVSFTLTANPYSARILLIRSKRRERFTRSVAPPANRK